MSAEKVTYNLLKNSAALIAVVPVARIYPSLIPLNTALPAIAYSFVSGVETTAIGLTTSLKRDRVQVTIAAKSYPDVKSIMALVVSAMNNKQGTFNGVKVDSVIKDVVGPDLRDDEAGVFYQSIDFKIDYH